jgi:hypothetical protein
MQKCRLVLPCASQHEIVWYLNGACAIDPSTAIFATLFVLLVTACSTTTPGVGKPIHEREATNLPAGLRLLESEGETCKDCLRVGQALDIVLKQGQYADYALNNQYVVWSCAHDDDARERHELHCPSRTTHARVTRSATDHDFLEECFGY